MKVNKQGDMIYLTENGKTIEKRYYKGMALKINDYYGVNNYTFDIDFLEALRSEAGTPVTECFYRPSRDDVRKELSDLEEYCKHLITKKGIMSEKELDNQIEVWEKELDNK